jgi:amidase
MPTSDFLADVDAIAQAELVARGELTAGDLLDAYEQRYRATNPLIRAVVTSDLEQARRRPPRTGPLAGVPFLVKDVMSYPGMRCSFGARLFANNIANEGSPFTQRIDEAGLVTVGKSASSEFGLLGSTETLLEGATHNPWNLAYSASGSSGGAAAAVAAGIVPLAHANDGGGSIRVPASVCGVFGLKPSRGRTVPAMTMRSDFTDLTSDLCVSRTVRDSALFLSLVEGNELPPVGFVREPNKRRLRIGAFTTTLLGGEPAPAVRTAFEDAALLCRSLGHEVVSIAAPVVDGKALSLGFFTIAGAALSGLSDMMSGMLQRPLGAGDLEPFTRMLIDRYKTSGDLGAAREVFARASQAYSDVLATVDVVLTPTLATLPWRLGHLSPTLDYDTLIARTEEAVCYTPIHNAIGAPAMSVPLHMSAEGLPIGSHFAAPVGREDVLLALAYELEQARPWRDRKPPFSYRQLA